MHDRPAETMPRADIAALQLSRLKNSLTLAGEKVPHYTKAFAAAGVTPADLASLNDLQRFPFTVKNDLRDNYPFGMFATPRTALARLHASSGTTGKPTVVGYTQDDIALWTDLMARSLACCGVLPGDIVHNAYGYGLFTGGLGAHYGAERLGCTVVPVSGGGTERQVTLLTDFGARVLCATPSYALNIAEVAARQGIDLRAVPVAIGVFGAEPWTAEMRAELEDKFAMKAVNVYGLSEILGPGVASECHVAQNGLHGWEDHFLFELIDPDTLDPVPEGEPGELVITTLTKQAMPMIRYRTRDMTRLSTQACQCGRTHVRILGITGRSDDMLIIHGVNIYPSQVESVLLGLAGLAPYYQLVVSQNGPMNALRVEVEAQTALSEDARKTKAADVKKRLKAIIGLTCEVAVLDPGAVPRSEGKAVRVRDLRD
jgi:phenylacetate-CoA ligase